MSNFSITIDDHGLARDLASASNDLETVIDQATDDAREPLGDAFWHETHKRSGDLRAANELIAGPGFRMTISNFMPYATFEDARHHFVARSVERGERGVIATYEREVDEYTERFGGDNGE